MVKVAVITGASSGLGLEIARAMYQYWIIYDWSHDTGVDVSDWWSVSKAKDKISHDKIDVLINCAGINRIAYLENVNEDDWDDVMASNAKSIFLCCQHLLSKLEGGTILNIVSNAAHVPMTSSLAYNASKGAAHIMTKQLARELMPRHGITVFSISPNKLKGTGMSEDIDRQVQSVRGWTVEEARKYQLQALLTKEETDPQDLAEFIAWLLSEKRRHKWFAGCDIPYGL